MDSHCGGSAGGASFAQEVAPPARCTDREGMDAACDDLLDDPWFERTGPLAAPVMEAAEREPAQRPRYQRVAMTPLAKPVRRAA